MRLIGLAVVLSLTLTPLAAVEAQQVGKVYQVGLLTLGSDPTRSGFWQKFLEAMRELDYVEGRNLIVRRAFADGKGDRLPGLVADLVQSKVDLIVTTSTQETKAAKRAKAGQFVPDGRMYLRAIFPSSPSRPSRDCFSTQNSIKNSTLLL